MIPNRYEFPPIVQGPGLVDLIVADKTTGEALATIRGAELRTNERFHSLRVFVRYPNHVRDLEGSLCNQATWDFHSVGFDGIDPRDRGLMFSGFLTEANHYPPEVHEAIAAMPVSDSGDPEEVLAVAPQAKEELSDGRDVRYTGQRIHPLSPQHFQLVIAHRGLTEQPPRSHP